MIYGANEIFLCHCLVLDDGPQNHHVGNALPPFLFKVPALAIVVMAARAFGHQQHDALMASDHLGTRIHTALTPGELLLGTPVTRSDGPVVSRCTSATLTVSR